MTMARPKPISRRNRRNNGKTPASKPGLDLQRSRSYWLGDFCESVIQQSATIKLKTITN